MATGRLEEIIDARKEKLTELRSLGIDPYTARAEKDTHCLHITVNFEEMNGKTVVVAGRLMALREHGKLSFGQVQDETGRIQLFLRADDMHQTDKEKQLVGYDQLHLIDVGDIVQAKGEVAKTKTGEISVLAKELRLLTKSMLPLPDKWDGISDPEIAVRKRYLDLIMNPEKIERFKRKAKFWQANRDFMRENGFIEVETPVLELVTGGADARPFVTHMNALDQDYYLRISTELYQKRLIGAGFEKIYTFGPNFRNEGISDEHLPEYNQIEWYLAYADYRKGMELVERMMRYVAQETYGRTKFTSRGHTFDLAEKWELIDYVEIIKDRFGVDIFTATEEEMMKKISENGVKLTGAINRNRLIDNLWKIIRKTIAGPAFLINEPRFMSPLAKVKPEDGRLTERFHVVIAGSELGNGYSELNDPQIQYDNFKEQQDQREQGDEEAQMMDTDYVEMLQHGMPPTCGYAHSERLFWFLEDISAREGVLFPPLRSKNEKIEI